MPLRPRHGNIELSGSFSFIGSKRFPIGDRSWLLRRSHCLLSCLIPKPVSPEESFIAISFSVPNSTLSLALSALSYSPLLPRKFRFCRSRFLFDFLFTAMITKWHYMHIRRPSSATMVEHRHKDRKIPCGLLAKMDKVDL